MSAPNFKMARVLPKKVSDVQASKHLDENQENILELISVSEVANGMKTFPQTFQVLYAPRSGGQESSQKSRTLDEGTMKSSSSSRSPKPSKRRSLATLQVSASGKGTVVGSFREEFVSGKKKSSIRTKPSHTQSKQSRKKVLLLQSSEDEEPRPQSSEVDSVKTSQNPTLEELPLGIDSSEQSLANEALKLMRSEPAPEAYWKELAEERRTALEEALQENEKLYGEIDILKERCDKLETALSEAEYYKLLYAALLEQINGDNNSKNAGTSLDEGDGESVAEILQQGD